MWLLTLVLGGLFLYGTAQEWHRLIYQHGLTISTNLFGTTYYSLVGLHALHVTVGLAMIAIVSVLAAAGRVGDCAPRTGRCAVAVLAFRRRRVGGRVHRGLRHRSLRSSMSTLRDRDRGPRADRLAPGAGGWMPLAVRGAADECIGDGAGRRARPSQGVWAGFGKSFRHQHEDVRWRCRRRLRSRRSAVASNGWRSRPTSCAHGCRCRVSGLCRREGRPGGKRRHGRARVRVRCAQQDSIWYPINLLAATVYAESLKFGPDSCVSRERLAIAVLIHGARVDYLWGFFTARCSPCSRAGRFFSEVLIAPILWSGCSTVPRTGESPAGQSHRLAVVHGVPARFRHRRRGRRATGRARADTREPVLRDASWHRSSGAIPPGGGGETLTVSAFRYLSARRENGHGAPVRLRSSAWTTAAGTRQVLAPRDVVEFGSLYSENCAACHGRDGQGGPAIALANPVYLAIADDRRFARPLPRRCRARRCRPSPRAPAAC